MKKLLLFNVILFLATVSYSQSWSLTGNSGTTTSNFLGSTDGKSLYFRTNNINSMIVDYMGKVGIGIMLPKAELHLHVDPDRPLVSNPPTGTTTYGTTSGTGIPLPPAVTTFLMTNPNTGTNATDGFKIIQTGLEVALKQQENALFKIQNNGNGLTIDPSGNIGIGTNIPHQKIHIVDGNICAKEVRVSLSGDPCWPDFVFNEDFQLPKLKEIEQYIQTHKHLPDVPSASEVALNGIQLGEMNAVLLQKVRRTYALHYSIGKEDRRFGKERR
ncbi:MAG: hypothetical protein LBU51_07475 [Bacteroidales bacterium]|jgi:hypothetical protein|nr:hypothetical protein [Bacteroidales bacterium]